MKHSSFPLIATATTISSFRHYHHGLFLLLLASSFVSSLAGSGESPRPNLGSLKRSYSSPTCPADQSDPGKKVEEESSNGLTKYPNGGRGGVEHGTQHIDSKTAMSCECPLIEEEAFIKLRERAPSISKRLHESTRKALESADETAEMIHLLKLLEKSDDMLNKFHDKMHEKAQELKNIFEQMHRHLKGKK
ncbi:uncharacterized protein LOC132313274 isoform X2 [Cornus florida]|uniref:uncharacterized protein LOC132313274 isoform X2 n=1 Tax=Cornus florida TaxID=4283 RepID=UPI00289F9EF9|nr:uncharacterized protein LOC132313274 isoform X2 [Cornus florida]